MQSVLVHRYARITLTEAMLAIQSCDNTEGHAAVSAVFKTTVKKSGTLQISAHNLNVPGLERP